MDVRERTAPVRRRSRRHMRQGHRGAGAKNLIGAARWLLRGVHLVEMPANDPEAMVHCRFESVTLEAPAGRLGDSDEGRDHWYDRVLTRLGLKPRESIRHDLEDALAETVEDTDFSPRERAMLKNVLSFHRIRVEDVMVPRADIVAVSADTNLGDLLSLFRTAGHSRALHVKWTHRITPSVPSRPSVFQYVIG